MGVKATEVLEVSYDDLPVYLHANHSVYMDVAGETYYLTDVNELPFADGKSVKDLFDTAIFYASVKPE